MKRLAAASWQLRRSGILTELQSLSRERSLSKPYEFLVRKRPGARRTIIVFTGASRRFWLSLNVFHYFIRALDAHVIYLSDHSGRLYLNGLKSIGLGYGAMLEKLGEQSDLLGAPNLHVMAISAGGFVGLRTAIDLKANSFAGMSVMTTLAPSNTFPKSHIANHMVSGCLYPEMLIDLRPKIEASEYPQSIHLYRGDLNTFDRAHMEISPEFPRPDAASRKLQASQCGQRYGGARRVQQDAPTARGRACAE